MTIRQGAQTRKSLADIARRKTQSIVLLLAIMLPVGGLTAVSVADDSLSASYAFTLSEHSRSNDIVVGVDHEDGALTTALARKPNIAAIQTASVLNTQWHVSAAPGHVDFRLVGYPNPRHVPLTPFQLLSGSYPGRDEIVMEYGDLGLQRFHLGDRVAIDTAHGTADLRIVGIARTPGSNPATTGIAIGYTTRGTVLSLPAFDYSGGAVQRQPSRNAEISLRLRHPSAYASTVASLGSLFHASDVTVLGVLPPQGDASVTQLRGILTLARVLLTVALALSVALVMSAVTALVTGQARVIGTMKALGATRAVVVRGYLTTTLALGVAATPVGIALGILLGGELASSMAASIPLAPGPTIISAATIGLALAIGIALPLLAALTPLWLGTRTSVHAALSDWGTSGIDDPTRTGPRRASVSRLVWVPQTALLGVRGLFRRPWRAGISVATIAVAAATFLAVASVASSVNTSIGSVWGSFHADVEVYVGGNTSYRQLSRVLAHVPNIRRTERVGWFGSNTAWGKVGVWGIEPESKLHEAHLTSGRWFRPTESGVCVISTDLASRSGLRTGSTLTIPGPGGVRSRRFIVIGMTREPVDDLSQVGTLDMPIDDLYRLEGAPTTRLADYTNRVLVQARSRTPAAVDQLARAIDAIGRQASLAGKEGPIAEVFTFRDEVVRHQRNFQPVYLLLLAGALIVAVIGGLGLAGTLTASVIERHRDIGLLRSLGATGRRIATVFWVESVALSLIAWTVAALAGVPLAYMFVQFFRRRVMPTDFHFAPSNLIVMIGLTLALASLAAILPARRAATLQAAELLRAE